VLGLLFVVAFVVIASLRTSNPTLNLTRLGEATKGGEIACNKQAESTAVFAEEIYNWKNEFIANHTDWRQR